MTRALAEAADRLSATRWPQGRTRVTSERALQRPRLSGALTALLSKYLVALGRVVAVVRVVITAVGGLSCPIRVVWMSLSEATWRQGGRGSERERD